jgi:hypothetical protein
MLLGAVCSWGQGAGTPSTDKWILLQSKDNVKVFRNYKMCDGNQMVFLKIENSTEKRVTVSWKSQFQIAGLKIPADKNFSLTVEAHSTLSGDCSKEVLSLNPYLYVSVVEEGKCDYIIQDLNIVII